LISHRLPEREALLALLEKNTEDANSDVRNDAETPSLRLAQEYLGGRRKAKVDDNIVSTRQWGTQPAMASAFGKEKIKALDGNERREVELHLPSMSDE